MHNAIDPSCGIEAFPGGGIIDLEYADDIALLEEDPAELQNTLDRHFH